MSSICTLFGYAPSDNLLPHGSRQLRTILDRKAIREPELSHSDAPRVCCHFHLRLGVCPKIPWYAGPPTEPSLAGDLAAVSDSSGEPFDGTARCVPRNGSFADASPLGHAFVGNTRRFNVTDARNVRPSDDIKGVRSVRSDYALNRRGPIYGACVVARRSIALMPNQKFSDTAFLPTALKRIRCFVAARVWMPSSSGPDGPTMPE